MTLFIKKSAIHFSLPMIFVLFVIFNSLNMTWADISGYDREEEGRRALKSAQDSLDNIDRQQKELARLRYDEKHGSGHSDDSGVAMVLVVGFFIVIGIAVSIALGSSKKNELAKIKEREIEKEKKEILRKTQFKERLAKAVDLGFPIDNMTKECPSCAETIKLKASTCRYCKKEFSEDDKTNAISICLDEYFKDHPSMLKQQLKDSHQSS